jgi:hypothetical protein
LPRALAYPSRLTRAVDNLVRLGLIVVEVPHLPDLFSVKSDQRTQRHRSAEVVKGPLREGATLQLTDFGFYFRFATVANSGQLIDPPDPA